MSQQHLECCQAAGRAPFHDEPTPSHPHSIAIAPQQSVSGLVRFQSSRLRSRTRCMTTDNKFNAHRSFRHASDKFAPFLLIARTTQRANPFACRCLRAFAGKTMREIRRCYDARHRAIVMMSPIRAHRRWNNFARRNMCRFCDDQYPDRRLMHSQSATFVCATLRISQALQIISLQPPENNRLKNRQRIQST